ncbi:hypothetical protein RND81_09G253600 [Saponaria officinalis]|uniref:F-box domain-containing protein n=1 Tax=Saponaria officinalis TaxID=3572 RepID=A0AAW1IRI5_SAPOF
MFFFILTSSISFILFLNSLHLKPLVPFYLRNEFPGSPFFPSNSLQKTVVTMKTDSICTSKVENVEQTVLDLPELALDCILEKLSPTGLLNMGAVCRSLRDRCIGNNLWERHLNCKWGRVLGPAAYRAWKSFVESKTTFLNSSSRKKSQGFSKFSGFFWDFSWFQSKFYKNNNININNKVDKCNNKVDCVMSWYLALESGKFWFPAQVYNRENGHVGFMLSCYDAELSYDSQTDTFNARYTPHGIRAVAMESGVQWDRVRVSPVETSPRDLHVSDCLNDLRPGDHFEIQWRRNKEFPYGWWYGVIGHLETCDGNENYCRCCESGESYVTRKSYMTLK